MAHILKTVEELEGFIERNDDGEYVAYFAECVLRSVYQPIMDRFKHIVAFEALIRASDLTGKEVSPALLFREVEENTPEWIAQINLDRICQLLHLRNFSLQMRQYQLFLNMLPSSMISVAQHAEIETLIISKLNELAALPEHLVFELTEHLCGEASILSFAIEKKREQGLKLAVDDYGVEGSLEHRVYLIQPDYLKIDRSLLQAYMQGKTEGLLQSLLLARTVNAKIVVEGIETPAEFEAMQALDVDYFQGFYLRRPLPIHTHIDWIARQHEQTQHERSLALSS